MQTPPETLQGFDFFRQIATSWTSMSSIHQKDINWGGHESCFRDESPPFAEMPEDSPSFEGIYY